MRWDPAFRAVGKDDVETLWGTRNSGRTLLIGGAGFDPRAPVAYECISGACPLPVDVIEVRLEPLATDPATKDLAVEGRKRIEDAVAASGATLRDHAADGTAASSTGLMIARDFFSANYIDDYSEVIVDVSALPRSVFFPLVRGLLEKHDREEWAGDLHIVACDNPGVDRLVTGEGVEPPAALPGFGDRSPLSEGGTRIWVPVLGEGETTRVEELYLDIPAQEVCPVLPFPSADPRRADDIVREYRELLFDRIVVEPRNFIYAAESNPFDLYRTLSRLNERYAEALKPLGDTRMILSAHSSKLLSIGVLLTAYEHELEVRHASPSLYTFADPGALPALAEKDLIVDLWLTGEPYA
jgi:hypothetical protein